MYVGRRRRRGSESNGVFTNCQPQYPDLLGYFNLDSTGVQGPFDTTRHLPDVPRHIHPAYSVIEEIVEEIVEGFNIYSVFGLSWRDAANATQ
jgi:hypothetical protein